MTKNENRILKRMPGWSFLPVALILAAGVASLVFGEREGIC